MQGQLFTEDFLETGIAETDHWRSVDDRDFKAFEERVSDIYHRFGGFKDANEATTERELIDPILKALGWEHFIVQQFSSKDRTDIPDYLLFASEEAWSAARKERKNSEPISARHRHR